MPIVSGGGPSSNPRVGQGAKNIGQRPPQIGYPSRPIGQGRGKGGSGLGKGLGFGGKGIGKARPRRLQGRMMKDSVQGITRGDIRRLARRGGVKRISAKIYDDIRHAMVSYLRQVLHDCYAYVEHGQRRTVTVTDVIFSLKRIGKPIYGFDKETYNPNRTRRIQ